METPFVNLQKWTPTIDINIDTWLLTDPIQHKQIAMAFIHFESKSEKFKMKCTYFYEAPWPKTYHSFLSIHAPNETNI